MPDEIAGDAEHEAQEIEQTDMDSVPTISFKKSFGSSELFGRSWFWCQFKKPRSYKKKTPAPEWTRSNVEIKKLVEHAFPKWRSNPSEHFYAARWIPTIYWHYRQGDTCIHISR